MKRRGSNPAISTQVKYGLNTFLNGAGLQISTTRAERIEKLRLEKLAASGHWDTAPFSPGLSFDPEQYLSFLKTICGPYHAELCALSLTQQGGEQFYRNNGWFESVDCDVLYGVIRLLKPVHIIEIGSGHSSRLTAQAIRDGQLPTRLTCVDPKPRVEIRHCADEFIERPAEELPVDELPDRLGPGDVLFIDSSHLVRTGGDVVYLYLQVLPRLRAGVLIHVHDIFLPFDYPERFVIQERWGWGEQYLVHALLMGNSDFEILWPSCYMWQMKREAVQVVLPVEKSFPPPSSLWLKKTGVPKR